MFSISVCHVQCDVLWPGTDSPIQQALCSLFVFFPSLLFLSFCIEQTEVALQDFPHLLALSGSMKALRAAEALIPSPWSRPQMFVVTFVFLNQKKNR